jgi:hypothetical protein
MRFPAHRLLSTSGEIYSHIFENPRAGVERSLFWSVTAEFAPIEHGDEVFECSMTCEWIKWPFRQWMELDGRSLHAMYDEYGVEFSFYMRQHHIGKEVWLSLIRSQANRFLLDMKMDVNFLGYYGGDEESSMRVVAKLEVPYLGTLIVPDNLSPKPETMEAIQQAAAPFVESACYAPPALYNGNFILRPLV